jgi:hypothetical protein
MRHADRRIEGFSWIGTFAKRVYPLAYSGPDQSPDPSPGRSGRHAGRDSALSLSPAPQVLSQLQVALAACHLRANVRRITWSLVYLGASLIAREQKHATKDRGMIDKNVSAGGMPYTTAA